MVNQNDDKSNSENKDFASMTEEEQREIASKGGNTTHESGNAHEVTSQQVHEADPKEGEASQGGSGGGNNS